MKIKLFSGFYKKKNSTAIPDNTVTYLELDGTLKEDCSTLNPTVRILRTALDLVPDTYNYAYIQAFGRYYFIVDCIWSEPFWEMRMAVDVLASWKTDIGLETHYILRTNSLTTDYNPMITDTMYPATCDMSLAQYYLTSAFVSSIASGIYVVGVISGNDTSAVGAISYYAMTATEFGALKDALLSNDNLETMEIIDSYGQMLITDMSKEVFKAMYNPYQYIVSCMWFPFAKSSISCDPVTKIKIGWWEYNLNGSIITAQNVTLFEGPTTIHQHPQASYRGTYLNYAPYTRCTAFGIFGTIPVDLSYFDIDDNTLIIRYIIDLITGQCRTRIESYNSSEVSPVHHNVTERDFLCGVPIQLAQIATDYLGAAVAAVDTAANTTQNLLSLNVGGAISSAAHGIYNTINAAMPQLSTSGTNGSFIITNSHLQTAFVYQHFTIVDEDIDHKGRPLCETRTLNTLSGYVLCSDGEISVPCLDAEKDMISEFLTSGFFWE